ncbi:MAG: hypothetical protein PHE88_02870 [Elusimicrobia bacterium]|nr:hypothetical protein [Elusimicrobiota bacterium]
MNENGFFTRVFGESHAGFVRSIITYFGILIFLAGIVLIVKAVSGNGTIDIKMALDEGKLGIGSVGIVLSFLGFLLLLVSSLFRDRS